MALAASDFCLRKVAIAAGRNGEFILILGQRTLHNRQFANIGLAWPPS
jgi:hypothetical protein